MKSLTSLKVFLLTMFIAVAACGCGTPDYDEYYVKFVIGINPGDDVNITYNDTYHRTHEITGVQKEEVIEQIVGPVYGGFRAVVEATVNGGEAPRFLQIEMSLNGAPYETVEYVERGRIAIWNIPISD